MFKNILIYTLVVTLASPSIYASEEEFRPVQIQKIQTAETPASSLSPLNYGLKLQNESGALWAAPEIDKLSFLSEFQQVVFAEIQNPNPLMESSVNAKNDLDDLNLQRLARLFHNYESELIGSSQRFHNFTAHMKNADVELNKAQINGAFKLFLIKEWIIANTQAFKLKLSQLNDEPLKKKVVSDHVKQTILFLKQARTSFAPIVMFETNRLFTSKEVSSAGFQSFLNSIGLDFEKLQRMYNMLEELEKMSVAKTKKQKKKFVNEQKLSHVKPIFKYLPSNGFESPYDSRKGIYVDTIALLSSAFLFYFLKEVVFSNVPDERPVVTLSAMITVFSGVFYIAASNDLILRYKKEWVGKIDYKLESLIKRIPYILRIHKQRNQEIDQTFNQNFSSLLDTYIKTALGDASVPLLNIEKTPLLILPSSQCSSYFKNGT